MRRLEINNYICLYTFERWLLEGGGVDLEVGVPTITREGNMVMKMAWGRFLEYYGRRGKERGLWL